ncbi:MAG: ribosome maturation factor RimM [Syntrophotalea sp.]|jgi:16S rRNA processing protein RimM|uniref:ribosome maturation factor RimM n=1 Tax=Syntrophotalea sp. TaxID=2812029 RepID=UPI003D12D123
MVLQPGALLILGVVVGTHGLRGDLKVRGCARDASLLSRIRQLVFLRDDQRVLECVRRKSDWHKGQLLVSLSGLDSIDAVQHLVGCEVAVHSEDVPAAPAGEYYWFQLKGLAARDRRLGDIGRLDDIFTTPAHEIYVIGGAYGEVLVPAVAAFLVEVDLEKRYVLFDLPEGLVEEE